MHAYVVEVPIQTTNDSNNFPANHFVKNKRRQVQRTAVWAAMHRDHLLLMELKSWPGWRVTLTRVAPSRGLDDDGLRTALKSVRDEVTKQLGVGKYVKYRKGPRTGQNIFVEDDRDPRIKFDYDQRRGPYSVLVRLEMAGGAR